MNGNIEKKLCNICENELDFEGKLGDIEIWRCDNCLLLSDQYGKTLKEMWMSPHTGIPWFQIRTEKKAICPECDKEMTSIDDMWDDRLPPPNEQWRDKQHSTAEITKFVWGSLPLSEEEQGIGIKAPELWLCHQCKTAFIQIFYPNKKKVEEDNS